MLLLLQASEDTRALIPAKAFEYLRTGRPILALTLDGDTADLLRGLEACHVVDPSHSEALRASILALYDAWRGNDGVASVPRPVKQFERRHLTTKLAEILHELT